MGQGTVSQPHRDQCQSSGSHCEKVRNSALQTIVANLDQKYPGRFVFQLPRDFFATIRAHDGLPPESNVGDP
jgi:hypothetical protein